MLLSGLTDTVLQAFSVFAGCSGIDKNNFQSHIKMAELSLSWISKWPYRE